MANENLRMGFILLWYSSYASKIQYRASSFQNGSVVAKIEYNGWQQHTAADIPQHITQGQSRGEGVVLILLLLKNSEKQLIGLCQEGRKWAQGQDQTLPDWKLGTSLLLWIFHFFNVLSCHLSFPLASNSAHNSCPFITTSLICLSFVRPHPSSHSHPISLLFLHFLSHGLILNVPHPHVSLSRFKDPETLLSGSSKPLLLHRLSLHMFSWRPLHGFR